LSKLLPGKAAKEPEDAPEPEPEQKIIRQQPTRQPRSKRTGSKKP
jgi:YidC/Oxa1 family membrane protein insertase